MSIVKIQLHALDELLVKNGYTLEISDEVYKDVASQAYDPQYGARPLKRYIQKNVINELSRQILSDNLNKGKPVKIDVFDGKYVFYQK